MRLGDVRWLVDPVNLWQAMRVLQSEWLTLFIVCDAPADHSFNDNTYFEGLCCQTFP